jgi:hypothetical protein
VRAGLAGRPLDAARPSFRPPGSVDLLCTSTFSPGSTRPWLGRTQYCLGAVVLTLKATGWGLGLWMSSERLTIWVSGPGYVSGWPLNLGGDCVTGRCRMTLATPKQAGAATTGVAQTSGVGSGVGVRGSGVHEWRGRSRSRLFPSHRAQGKVAESWPGIHSRPAQFQLCVASVPMAAGRQSRR